MTTTYQDIFSAIMGRIEDNWNAVAAPVHWPATRFKPLENGAPWIQPRLVFNTAEQITLGLNGHNRIEGDLDVRIFAAIGAGEEPLLIKADALRDLFPRGTVLSAGSRRIHFRTPSVRPAIEEEDFIQIPVFCPFWIDETT
jgi:Bacteriophage related domain of unknown function